MAGHVSAVLTLDGEVAGFLEAVGEGVGAAGEEEEHLDGFFGVVDGIAGCISKSRYVFRIGESLVRLG